MSQTLKFGNGTWATKKGSTLAYNDLGGNFKPLPFTYTGAGKGTRVNKEGLIEVVENDRPRIDYTDSEDGVFLLEKAATNLVTYSSEYTNSSWNKVNSAGSTLPNITSNYGISPDGTLNADRIQVSRASGVGDYSSVYKSITTSSSSRGLSVWLKSLSGTPTILIANNNGVYVSQKITTEWVRYELDLGVGTLTELQLSVVGSNFVQGVSESADFLAWGYQLEVGNVSSYIPTQGTIQTRVQETASGSGNSEVFNDNEGVLFADISANSDDSSERFLGLSNGSTANRISLWYYSATNGLAVAIYSSSVTQFFTTTVLPKDTLYNKISVKYKQNDFSLWVNGFEIATDTSGNTPIGLSELSFDRGDGALDFYGKTKEIGYYDTALTDLELETLTSYRTWEAMVKELNLNIIHNE